MTKATLSSWAAIPSDCTLRIHRIGYDGRFRRTSHANLPTRHRTDGKVYQVAGARVGSPATVRVSVNRRVIFS